MSGEAARCVLRINEGASESFTEDMALIASAGGVVVAEALDAAPGRRGDRSVIDKARRVLRRATGIPNE